MKNILLLSFLTIIFSKSELNAQELSKAYLDSVKSFYAEWVENQPDFVFTIMDNTTFTWGLDFILNRINQNSLLESPCTVYKINPHKTSNTKFLTIEEKRKYCNDSITLTENETNLAIEKLKQSKSFKWTKYCFPMAEITDSSSYFSKLINRTSASQKLVYWEVSLPCFFRKGTFAMIYYLYYCGGDCGYDGLVIYKNESGHWNKFGALEEGEF